MFHIIESEYVGVNALEYPNSHTVEVSKFGLSEREEEFAEIDGWAKRTLGECETFPEARVVIARKFGKTRVTESIESPAGVLIVELHRVGNYAPKGG